MFETMAPETIFIITILGAVLAGVLLFYIIRLAVKSALIEVEKEIRVANQLKIVELSKTGMDESELIKMTTGDRELFWHRLASDVPKSDNKN